MTRNNTPNSIKTEITAIIYKLTRIGLAVDQNLPLIKNKGRDVDVTWAGQTYLSVALKKNSDYNKIYEEILKQRNYNLRLKDGSIIQICYRFNGNKLVSSRLTYLPNPFSNETSEFTDFQYNDDEDDTNPTLDLYLDNFYMSDNKFHSLEFV